MKELKESTDFSVRTFVKEVETMKRLTAEERQYCLKHRQEPEAIRKIVKDFIPYIIYVAYSNCHKVKVQSVLDLINEGILGAYAAFEKNRKEGEALTRKKVARLIKSRIHNAVLREHFEGFAEVDIDECLSDIGEGQGEDEVIDDINGQWLRLFLTEMIMEEMGSRDGGIIIDYYLGEEDDLGRIGKKYGISRERVRQITRSLSKLYKKAENLKSIRQF